MTADGPEHSDQTDSDLPLDPGLAKLITALARAHAERDHEEDLKRAREQKAKQSSSTREPKPGGKRKRARRA